MQKKLITWLKSYPKEQLFPIDHIIFEYFLSHITVYQMYPALSIQAENYQSEHLKSDLEHERQQKTIKSSNMTLQDKLQRFFKKLYRSIGKRTFFKKVPFK